MESTDKIRAHLKGTTDQQERRAGLLTQMLEALAQGGHKNVTVVLTRRMAELDSCFDQQLSDLALRLEE